MIINILLYLTFAMTHITKTIQEPLALNLSPADVLWPVLGVVWFTVKIKTKTLKEIWLKDKRFQMVLYLTLWGVIVSVWSCCFNEPYSLDKKPLLKSLVINNIKSILITGYFILGMWASKRLNKSYVQVTGWVLTTLVCVIGLGALKFSTPTWALVGTRIIATVNDPNVAGWIILTGLLWSTGLLLGDHSKLFKVVVVGSLPLYLMTLLFTGSRTALAGLFLIAIVMLWFLKKHLRLFFLALSLSLLIGSMIIHIDRVLYRGQMYNQIAKRVFVGTEEANDTRVLLRNAAYEMGKEHPIMGVGSGQFPNLSAPYLEDLGKDITTKHFKTATAFKVAHNTFMTYFAERGLLGLLLFMGLLLMCSRSATTLPEWGFLSLVFLYGFFFNIENIRFAWFLLGGLELLKPVFCRKKNDEGFKEQNRNIRSILLKSNQFVAIIALFALGLTIHTAMSLPKPLQLLNGQNVEMNIGDKGLDMFLELLVDRENPLTITFEGLDEKKVEIWNTVGLYYEHFDLEPGIYKIIFSSDNGATKLRCGRLKSGNEDYFIYHKLWSTEMLGRKKLKGYYKSQLKLDLIQPRRSYSDTFSVEKKVVYGNQMEGINFEDQIQLIETKLEKEDVKGVYRMEWTFKKTGEIDNPYILLCRAYDLKDGRKDTTRYLTQNILFDPPLTNLAEGEEFTATWEFDTQQRPYLLSYGFYHKDKKTNETIRLKPNWVRQGYVQ